MSFFEILSIVLTSFRANKLRTFLTLLGVIIGVTTVITVVSIVKGMNRYVISAITQAGSNSFRIDRFGIITSMEEWQAAMKRKDLTVEDLQSVREHCQLCDETGGFTLAPSFMNETIINITAGRETIKDVQLFGVTSNYGVIANREIINGRYLTEWEVDHSTPSVVLGYEIAQNLFPHIDAVGKFVAINHRRFLVVGVLKKYGTIFHENQDIVAEIPITVFQKMFGKHDSVFIIVKIDDLSKMTQAEDQARLVLRSRHHRRYQDDDGFAILTTDNLIQLWKTFSAGAFAAMIGIASIALVVGGIVIMNIMLVSVVERTPEIGLRKAMGARNRDIRRQFMVESVILAGTGGIIGILLGAGAAKLVSALSPMPSSLETGPVIAGLLLASVVGLLSGMWPALKAARLDPIVALGTE
jgi:putative ABC transport system permease protein